MENSKLVDIDEVEQMLNIAASTWRAYVARGQAPKPAGYSPTTGRRVWDRDEVQAWQRARPGRGNWAKQDQGKGQGA